MLEHHIPSIICNSSSTFVRVTEQLDRDRDCPAANRDLKAAAIRRAGGTFRISFGGASGAELATKAKTVDALVKQYESVITAYDATWLDFDIEGASVADTSANARRNKALAKIPDLQRQLQEAENRLDLYEPPRTVLEFPHHD